MDTLIFLLQQHGVLLVFLWVLLEQAGMPLPAYPLLLLAGSMLTDMGALSVAQAAAAAVLACAIADGVWFWIGLRSGERVLRVVCSLSLTPQDCVGRARFAIDRWGPSSLLIAKFVPGFGAVSSVVAGGAGMDARRFFVYDILGSLLWAGSGLLLGSVLAPLLTKLLDPLDSIGSWLAGVAGVVLAAMVLRRLWAAKKDWRGPSDKPGIADSPD